MIHVLPELEICLVGVYDCETSPDLFLCPLQHVGLQVGLAFQALMISCVRQQAIQNYAIKIARYYCCSNFHIHTHTRSELFLFLVKFHVSGSHRLPLIAICHGWSSNFFPGKLWRIMVKLCFRWLRTISLYSKYIDTILYTVLRKQSCHFEPLGSAVPVGFVEYTYKYLVI